MREIGVGWVSRTIRKRYTGVLVRDGEWTHRCPEPNCYWCVRGRAKRAWNRKQRRDAKGSVAVWFGDEDGGRVVRWDRHVYDGWRCVFCDVNELDESIYGPFECVEHDGPVWVSESAGEAV